MSDLSMFQRVPDGLEGKGLFNHMIAFHHCAFAKHPEQEETSSHLHTDHLHSKEQEIDYARKVQGDIMEVVGNGVNLMVAAQSRLDNIGHLKSHCVNNLKSVLCQKEKDNL